MSFYILHGLTIFFVEVEYRKMIKLYFTLPQFLFVLTRISSDLIWYLQYNVNKTKEILYEFKFQNKYRQTENFA